MATRRRRRKSTKRTFYNILTLVFVLAIALVIYLIFLNGGGGKQQVTTKKPSTSQTTTPQSNAPQSTAVPVASNPDAQPLIGEWKSDSGVSLAVRAEGTLALGVTGNDEEAASYPYSVSGNNLTISFVEGSPVTATFSIDAAGQLTLQFEDSSLVFTPS